MTEGIARLVAAGHTVEVGAISDEELDANPALVKSMSVQPPRGVTKIEKKSATTRRVVLGFA